MDSGAEPLDVCYNSVYKLVDTLIICGAPVFQQYPFNLYSKFESERERCCFFDQCATASAEQYLKTYSIAQPASLWALGYRLSVLLPRIPQEHLLLSTTVLRHEDATRAFSPWNSFREYRLWPGEKVSVRYQRWMAFDIISQLVLPLLLFFLSQTLIYTRL